MSASEAFTESSLFAHSSREPASNPTAPTVVERAARTAVATAVSASEAISGSSDAADLEASGNAIDTPVAREAIAREDERKRLAEQLDALKRKEFELRRALAAADHPEAAEAIRMIGGSAFSVSRAEAKLAQGFPKSEARRREVIEKKLGTLRDKRADLDSQIGALEVELGGLGADRIAVFENERQAALEQLMIVLATHDAALSAAKLDPRRLVPELEGWMPELEALAKKMSAKASA